MTDENWKDWAFKRAGTIQGDLHRYYTQKKSAPPIVTKRNKPTTTGNYPLPQNTSPNTIPQVTAAQRKQAIKDRRQRKHEDIIGGLIVLGIVGLAVYVWFTNAEVQSIEWYYYFGGCFVLAWIFDYMLKNQFRFVLIIIRNLIEIALFIAVIIALIMLAYYIFLK